MFKYKFKFNSFQYLDAILFKLWLNITYLISSPKKYLLGKIIKIQKFLIISFLFYSKYFQNNNDKRKAALIF